MSATILNFPEPVSYCRLLDADLCRRIATAAYAQKYGATIYDLTNYQPKKEDPYVSTNKV